MLLILLLESIEIINHITKLIYNVKLLVLIFQKAIQFLLWLKAVAILRGIPIYHSMYTFR